MKRLLAVCLGVSLLAQVGSAVVIPVNCNLFFNGSNAVRIAWNAYYIYAVWDIGPAGNLCSPAENVAATAKEHLGKAMT